MIATAGPITGQYAIFGDQMKRGAEMAIQDLNEAGGVLGEQLLGSATTPAIPSRRSRWPTKWSTPGSSSWPGIFAPVRRSRVCGLQRGRHPSDLARLDQSAAYRTGAEQRLPGMRGDDAQGIFAADYVVDNNVGSKIAVLRDKTPMARALPTSSRSS